MTHEQKSVRLTRIEHGKVVFGAALLAVPFVGSALERIVSGADTEKRWKRVEQTLHEVGEKLDALGSAPGVESEHFSELIASTARSIGSATTEAKRVAFRELLVNAGHNPPSDGATEETTLVVRLLEQIEAPGLEILAAVGLSDQAAMITTMGPCRVVRSFGELNSSREGRHLSYDIPVVIEWVHRLQGLRTLRYAQPIHEKLAGGGTRTTAGFSDVYLTTLGRLLTKWTATGP